MITRDFAGYNSELAVSIADPNNPRKPALRVVVFSHLFPLRMDVG